MKSATNNPSIIRHYGYYFAAVVLTGVIPLWADIAEQAGAYAPASGGRAVYVDGQRGIRWRDNQQEVRLFGVNYCLPSGYSYRAIQYVGADHKRVIDADMAHLSRMGMNAIRLSFWGDWENSDKEGNLVDNIHLDLLDYVIAQASRRGIYMLLTPIVQYSPVWPEPEQNNTNQGFARFYPKKEMGINSAAIQVQQNYLSQVVSHINRYTKRAYKDEPAILFIEPVNEPYHHPENKPVDYINALTNAIRKAGWEKPVVFNVSQDMSIAAAIRDSKIDGGTYGWYPSGLVNGYSLPINLLPRVDKYRLMFDPVLKNKAKLVYEYDAADVAGSYIYPAIARTYRSAGVQFAAMFSYDPLAIAWANLEYQTHYLNLVYTPGKAVSMAIAAEVFYSLPSFETYGDYPNNSRFGSARVSYEQDLSEWVSDKQFLYSNHTDTPVPQPENLERIVGCGSSAVVQYEGTGVYFLDRLEAGIWRLEVYPDVVCVEDPFGKPARDREASRLVRAERRMKIVLPDLGSEFSITGVNQGNTLSGSVQNGGLKISPGIYVLAKAEMRTRGPWSATFLRGADFGEYYLPEKQPHPAAIRYDPPREISESRTFEVQMQIASDEEPQAVTLYYRPMDGTPFKTLSMRKAAVFQYKTEIPAEDIQRGRLDYAVAVQRAGQTMTFPAAVKELPHQIEQVHPEPVTLYEAISAGLSPELETWSVHDAAANIVQSEGKSVLQVVATGFDANGSLEIQLPLNGPSQTARQGGQGRYENAELLVTARGLTDSTTQMQLTLIDSFDMATSLTIPLNRSRHTYRMPLKDICLANLKQARIAVGAWLFPGNEKSPCGFEIERIAVRSDAGLWQVPVVSATSPFVLFDALQDTDRLIFPNSEHPVAFMKSRVTGMTAAAGALRIATPSFQSAPHDVSFRLIYDKTIEPRRIDLAAMDTIRIRARAGQKETACLELALIQRNGLVRSTAVNLTTTWQTIDIPLSQFAPAVITFLPRPYPTQFDYWDQGDKKDNRPLDMTDLQAIQISFGSRMFPKFTSVEHAIDIERIELTKTR